MVVLRERATERRQRRFGRTLGERARGTAADTGLWSLGQRPQHGRLGRLRHCAELRVATQAAERTEAGLTNGRPFVALRTLCERRGQLRLWAERSMRDSQTPRSARTDA